MLAWPAPMRQTYMQVLRARVKAVQFVEAGRLAFDDLPVADPGPLEVRLRPLAVGICGTDARILEGAYYARPGTVLGHEVAGVIDAVGSGVRQRPGGRPRHHRAAPLLRRLSVLQARPRAPVPREAGIRRPPRRWHGRADACPRPARLRPAAGHRSDGRLPHGAARLRDPRHRSPCAVVRACRSSSSVPERPGSCWRRCRGWLD